MRLAESSGPDASLKRSPFTLVVEPAANIRLCRVDIEVLVHDWLGDPALADLRRPARDLGALPCINEWLAPEERETVNRFKSLKRQVEWLAGRLAVKRLVAECLDPGLSPTAVTVVLEPGGAPKLAAFPDHCLSITHAGQFAAAAVSLDPALAIGIDIERLPIPADAAFLNLAFSDRERIAFDPADRLAPAQAWILKEAYLKYIRQGFHRSLHRVEFLEGLLLEEGRPAPVRWTVTAPDPDHLLAVVWGPCDASGIHDVSERRVRPLPRFP